MTTVTLVDLGYGTTNVPLSSDMTVEDARGQILGLVVDEPDLNGPPPELE